MFTRLVVVAALVVAPFAVACGSSDTGSNSSSSDLKTSDNGTLGAQCGGFAGIACATGFECVTQGGFADALGTCEPALIGSEGATCGGIAALKCDDGLTCKKASESIDASGTCAKTPFATCHAVPACDSGDRSVGGCAASDASCYTRTLCGTTIACSK